MSGEPCWNRAHHCTGSGWGAVGALGMASPAAQHLGMIQKWRSGACRVLILCLTAGGHDMTHVTVKLVQAALRSPALVAAQRYTPAHTSTLPVPGPIGLQPQRVRNGAPLSRHISPGFPSYSSFIASQSSNVTWLPRPGTSTQQAQALPAKPLRLNAALSHLTNSRSASLLGHVPGKPLHHSNVRICGFTGLPHVHGRYVTPPFTRIRNDASVPSFHAAAALKAPAAAPQAASETARACTTPRMTLRAVTFSPPTADAVGRGRSSSETRATASFRPSMVSSLSPGTSGPFKATTPALTDPAQDVLDGIALIRRMWQSGHVPVKADTCGHGASSAPSRAEDQSTDADIRKAVDAIPSRIAGIRAQWQARATSGVAQPAATHNARFARSNSV